MKMEIKRIIEIWNDGNEDKDENKNENRDLYMKIDIRTEKNRDKHGNRVLEKEM